MPQPSLVIVTGRPAAGKTTLARLLADRLRCPLISRDAVKEGYIRSANAAHSDLDAAINLQIYETFFDTIGLLLSRNIPVIAEAAFQHQLWEPKLLALRKDASVNL